MAEMKPPPDNSWTEPEWKLVTEDTGERFPYKSTLYHHGVYEKVFFTDTRWGARRAARRYVKAQTTKSDQVWVTEIRP